MPEVSGCEAAQGSPGADHHPGCSCLLGVAGIHRAGDRPTIRIVFDVQELAAETVKGGWLEAGLEGGV